MLRLVPGGGYHFFLVSFCFLISPVNGSSNPLSVVVGVVTRPAKLRCCGAIMQQSLACYVVSHRAARPEVVASERGMVEGGSLADNIAYTTMQE